jgi:hypothetical protein
VLDCCEEVLKEKRGLCQRPQCLLACYKEILEEKKGSLSATSVLDCCEEVLKEKKWYWSARLHCLIAVRRF